jgi:ElaB/YqjD/DUF883 family membrane-anchored ribosome-binding protein
MESRLENATTTKNFSPEKFIEDLKDVIQRAQEKAVESAKDADKAIRTHPYQTVGIAFAVGLLVGFLARRR